MMVGYLSLGKNFTTAAVSKLKAAHHPDLIFIALKCPVIMHLAMTNFW